MARAIALLDGPDGLVHVKDDWQWYATDLTFAVCEGPDIRFDDDALRPSQARAPTCLWCIRWPPTRKGP